VVLVPSDVDVAGSSCDGADVEVVGRERCARCADSGRDDVVVPGSVVVVVAFSVGRVVSGMVCVVVAGTVGVGVVSRAASDRGSGRTSR
jgi:hypothetical protein